MEFNGFGVDLQADFRNREGFPTCTVSFYTHATKRRWIKDPDGPDERKLGKKGEVVERGRWEQVTYCQINLIGDTLNEFHGPADKPFHFHRPSTQGEEGFSVAPIDVWPDIYQAWINNGSRSGTALTQLGLQQAQIVQLNRYNIKTVEDLAGVSSQNLNKLGPGAENLREMAQKLLKDIGEANDITRLDKENAALKARLEALELSAKTKGDAIGGYENVNDDGLRAMLTDLGVKVDGRWARDRLLQEIQKATKSEAA